MPSNLWMLVGKTIPNMQLTCPGCQGNTKMCFILLSQAPKHETQHQHQGDVGNTKGDNNGSQVAATSASRQRRQLPQTQCQNKSKGKGKERNTTQFTIKPHRHDLPPPIHRPKFTPPFQDLALCVGETRKLTDEQQSKIAEWEEREGD